MSDEEKNTKAIAALNDRFRKRIGIPFFGVPPFAGTFVCTAGIAALPPEAQITIWFAVRDFDDFDEGNDPSGERDFGTIILPGVQEKIFWKIDYFADSTCTTAARSNPLMTSAVSGYRPSCWLRNIESACVPITSVRAPSLASACH